MDNQPLVGAKVKVIKPMLLLIAKIMKCDYCGLVSFHFKWSEYWHIGTKHNFDQFFDAEKWWLFPLVVCVSFLNWKTKLVYMQYFFPLLFLCISLILETCFANAFRAIIWPALNQLVELSTICAFFVIVACFYWLWTAVRFQPTSYLL